MNDDYLLRFAGIGRLYGTAALQAFANAHVCVIGIGGVGSWAAEALARSGIGAITLVDLDDICISNTNRQIHALTATVGQDKVDVMAERICKSIRLAKLAKSTTLLPLKICSKFSPHHLVM